MQLDLTEREVQLVQFALSQHRITIEVDGDLVDGDLVDGDLVDGDLISEMLNKGETLDSHDREVAAIEKKIKAQTKI